MSFLLFILFAEVIGVKKTTISKIELGTSYPTFANLDEIKEIADDVNFILEHQDILKDK